VVFYFTPGLRQVLEENGVFERRNKTELLFKFKHTHGGAFQSTGRVSISVYKEYSFFGKYPENGDYPADCQK
jgi:hypothetical protein